MPDKSRVLADRERSLEEQFFSRQSEELKRKLREKHEREDARAGLRRIAVITNEETIDRMVELGITAETWAAISLVPLVEVAWANGEVDAKERQAVLAAANANGLSPGSPGFAVLESWLQRRPDARLLQAWGEYIMALGAQLTPAERHRLRDELMSRARQVAETTGGFLGLGRRVSPEEEVVLQELEKAFVD